MNSNASAASPEGEKPQDLLGIRRRPIAAGCSLLLAVAAVFLIAVPGAIFFLAPVLQTMPRVWRRIGKLDAFQIGVTQAVDFEDAAPLPWAGITAKRAAFVRRENDTAFVAFSPNCTHLACPVRWMESAQLFVCPCHMGTYYKDGTVAAGPPPRPLFKYPIRVRNGEVEIQTTPIPFV
jgi:menaquinol-cytochrome c reductase iron-sulfur subunit